jgi:hypothetical protein
MGCSQGSHMKKSLAVAAFILATQAWSSDTSQKSTEQPWSANIWASFGGDAPQAPPEQEQWEAGVLVLLLGAFIAFGPHNASVD